MTNAAGDNSRVALEIFADWLSRCVQGERVAFEELLGSHPHLAPELEELAATRARLAAAGAPSDADAAMHIGRETPPSSQRITEDAPATMAVEVPAGWGSSQALIEQLAARTAGYGRFQIRGEVARGGMGAILAIWDCELRRELAMKVNLWQADLGAGGPAYRASGTSVERFIEEALITGQLDHPGIVPLHEFGLDPEGHLYFTMKLVKGRSLKEVFGLVARAEEGWTQTKALGVLLKACEAMAYAHDKGVLHRDLKPDNIMVGKYGEVYVMDWGLARARGRKGEKDIRIRMEGPGDPRPPGGRDDLPGEGADSPLHTMDGDVIGTPAYMPPEQALGRVAEVDESSDVYALGAMLYHLLAGHMPYAAESEQAGQKAILARVHHGPPAPLSSLAPRAPPELVAICETAMARAREQRYRSMSQLAADLAAYLEHRVVVAYETGTWAETRKWVERNKAVAASLTAAILFLMIGTLAALQQAGRAAAKSAEAGRSAAAEAVARRAAEHSADSAREQERIATERAAAVLSLSAIQDLDDLMQRADELWPAEPALIEEYSQWLAEARALIDGRTADPARGVKARFGLAEYERQLKQLEARGRPLSDDEPVASSALRALDAELARTRSKAEWMGRMLGKSPWPDEAQAEAELDQLTLARDDAASWNALACQVVLPGSLDYGREVEALLCARRAMESVSDALRYEYCQTLAWAFYRLGRFDESLEQGHEMVEQAPEPDRDKAEVMLLILEGAIARWRLPSGEPRPGREEEWSGLVDEVRRLEHSRALLWPWTFADADDRWWHFQLLKLIYRLTDFADPQRGLCSNGLTAEQGWGVEQRLAFARTIAERSVSGADAVPRWRDAIASIGDPEDCPMYAGLVLTPQLGLLPIGRDSSSGLWEFAHLQSGEPPERGADGQLIVSGETGLVLVLLPGVTAWLGAQNSDATAPNFDRYAGFTESPVHEVTLSPFFLSKYEMTQGQWLRIAGSNPSAFSPTSVNLGPYDLTHPVEQVTWTACSKVVRWAGLSIPTEAQWEYGCRAGTGTPWWTGLERESLRGRANLADRAAQRGGADWAEIRDWPDLDDGWAMHSPVDLPPSNPFGFRGMLGNVWEWCADVFASYKYDQASDPLITGDAASQHICRGGGFRSIAFQARSASRFYALSDYAGMDLGLRPARALSAD